MPMGHDAFAAQNICADAARRAGVLAYPTLWYGWSHHHMALPGTVTLRPSTLTAIVTDILKSMLYHGFNRAIVVNGHRRANLPPIEIAVNELRHQTGAALAVVDVGIVAFDRVAEIRTSSPGGVGHADEMETSHALHMNPGLVHLEDAKARMTDPEPRWLTGHHISDPAVDAPRFYFPKTVEEARKDVGDAGNTGDPTAATAEKGRAFHEAVVERLVGIIDYLKKVPLDVRNRPAPFD
jgi:creatinine amidohydrolase